jgi:Secretion system C-terminal sorting domain
MKHLYFLLLIMVPFLSKAQGWQWTKAAHSGVSEGYFCATDAQGNIYGCGNAGGTVVFDTVTLTGIGGGGSFIVKYDNAGNLKWAKSTTNGIAVSMGIATDRCGNVYLLGWYTNSIEIGTFVLNSSLPVSGHHQYYLAKFNSDGNILWAENVGNVDGGRGSICTDHLGNIYLACTFSNNPTIGAFSFTNADPTNITSDILIIKIDTSGGVLWARHYGGINNDLVGGICVTSSSNIYIAGIFLSPALTFGGTVLSDTSINYSLFLCKLDSNGSPLWAHNAYGTGGAIGLATDSYGNVFLCGDFLSSAFSLGPYSYYLPVGKVYGFLAKYDASGNVLWVKEMQGQVIINWSLATDPCNNIWVSGSLDYGLTDTIDGHIITPLVGGYDPMYFAGWTPTGSLIQAIALTSGGDDNNGIAADPYGNVCICGDYEYGKFIVGNDTLISPGSTEEFCFVTKYNPNLGCISSNIPDCHPSFQSDPLGNQITKLFPIPTRNEVHVEAAYTILSASITNLLGQTLSTNQYNSPQVQLDVSYLPPGIYLIKINNTEVRKFIKQ